jgi:hypothetical protein
MALKTCVKMLRSLRRRRSKSLRVWLLAVGVDSMAGFDHFADFDPRQILMIAADGIK